MYARYRTRSRFYKRPEKALKAYNVSPNLLRRPKVKPGLLHGIYADETVDLRDRERLEMLESIRHPKERDFYQDHTYHNQWISRDLEKHQKSQIASRYPYFAPGFQIDPWLWYPGDMVEVVSGEGVGQRGAIIAVVKYKNEILVQNINVQDVVIPASETRPEQIVQREHPINVLRVRHIDPSTNEMCHLEMVKVRNKETGALEGRRISLETGAMLPIPVADEAVDSGDPLKDTAIQDADEDTFDRAKELPLLVERRLQAMENHFVDSLRQSYEYHRGLTRRNAAAMDAFQRDVVAWASEKLAAAAADASLSAEGVMASVLEADAAAQPGTEGLPAWWKEMLDGYVAVVAEEEAEAAAEAAGAAEESARMAAEDGGVFDERNGESEREVGAEDGEEEELDGELDGYVDAPDRMTQPSG